MMEDRRSVRNLAKKLCDLTGLPRYFIQENMFELRMTGIRLYGLSPFRRSRIRKLQRHGELKLIFGCGATRYPGLARHRLLPQQIGGPAS